MIIGVTTVALALAIPTVAWAVRVVHWYSVGQPQAIQQRRQWLISQANHSAIEQACQQMLANPSQYPQTSGSAFPQSLSPALSTLGADAISIYPDGVLIMFERRIGLWVPTNSASPNFPIPPSQQLTSGLWLLDYPGH
jgi:hypothetical protein